MSSYDNAYVVTYNFPALDVGAGTITRKIRVPKGATGARVLDIHAFASETFSQTTTAARAQVGIAGDLDKFVDANLGALAAGNAFSLADSVGAHKGVWHDGEDDVSELTVTFVAPTGGTPAGIADFAIAVAWNSIGIA